MDAIYFKECTHAGRGTDRSQIRDTVPPPPLSPLLFASFIPFPTPLPALLYSRASLRRKGCAFF